jgi:hypothetical protein
MAASSPFPRSRVSVVSGDTVEGNGSDMIGQDATVIIRPPDVLYEPLPPPTLRDDGIPVILKDYLTELEQWPAQAGPQFHFVYDFMGVSTGCNM